MDWLNCFKSYRREYRAHALERMIKRHIGFSAIDEIVENLEIIEEYPSDFPYPSCLVLGYNKLLKPIHIVFSVNEAEKMIYIITVYEPDAQKWESDFRRRKE